MKRRKLTVVILVLALCACSNGEVQVEYPGAQREFFRLNTECRVSYEKGTNEIQQSLVFNKCNGMRSTFAQRSHPVNWVGTITNISTDQGADVVSLDIVSKIEGFEIKFRTVNNRASDVGSDSLITPGDPLFAVLRDMQVGEWVMFSGEFLLDPSGSRGIWESSLTERGSIEEPEFNVRFSSIRPLARNLGMAKNKEREAPEISVGAQPASDAVVQSGNYHGNSRNFESTQAAIRANGMVDLREAPSPSFNCDRAVHASEKIICENSTLARVDRYTARMYRCLRDHSPADREMLKSKQREWLPARDACEDDIGCLREAYGDIAIVYMESAAFNECQAAVGEG